MLIGIEFKRKKVFLIDENRTVWYWRIAPYVVDADPKIVFSVFFAVLGMSLVVLIGSIVESIR
jgi:hypothetical protein